MNSLNEARQIAGISIPELSNVVNLSYFDLAEMLKEESRMPSEIKRKIKIFLIKNYTKCIERL